MAVQAASGTTRAELRRVAETALRALAPLTAGPTGTSLVTSRGWIGETNALKRP